MLHEGSGGLGERNLGEVVWAGGISPVVRWPALLGQRWKKEMAFK
jgi:hypothetical protein